MKRLRHLGIFVLITAKSAFAAAEISEEIISINGDTLKTLSGETIIMTCSDKRNNGNAVIQFKGQLYGFRTAYCHVAKSMLEQAGPTVSATLKVSIEGGVSVDLDEKKTAFLDSPSISGNVFKAKSQEPTSQPSGSLMGIARKLF